jgi:hypothetical protein
LRIYHGKKVSKGRRTIRKQRYQIQPGTIVLYQGKKLVSNGVQHYGEYVTIKGLTKAIPAKDLKILKQQGGWVKIS